MLFKCYCGGWTRHRSNGSWKCPDCRIRACDVCLKHRDRREDACERCVRDGYCAVCNDSADVFHEMFYCKRCYRDVQRKYAEHYATCLRCYAFRPITDLDGAGTCCQ